MSALLARAQLFSAIEGGSIFWSNEIAELGAILVKDRIVSGRYGELNSSPKIADRIKQSSGEEVITQITSAGAFLLTPEDMDWPVSLNDLAAPPIALLIKGQREYLPNLIDSISIVGTRNPTPYGRRIAEDFGAGVADHEWAVVSGGAIGIDAAAHNGCLVGEGITVAVLGGGFNKNYPAAHEKLFAEISESGLLISEVMPDVPAIPHRFLTRNRLIAALSKATIVVEAAFRSGSLRTARDAAEIFRPVMAIPGPINSPTSEGCHRLIAERVAELVSSVSEVMELVKPISIK
ncbi:MAG: DNA-processing protein DprA [Actinobacteria bacterium]|nr:DNA-processing protein DprA [Actinomycetota bacterium]